MGKLLDDLIRNNASIEHYIKLGIAKELSNEEIARLFQKQCKPLKEKI